MRVHAVDANPGSGGATRVPMGGVGFVRDSRSGLLRDDSSSWILTQEIPYKIKGLPCRAGQRTECVFLFETTDGPALSLGQPLRRGPWNVASKGGGVLFSA